MMTLNRLLLVWAAELDGTTGADLWRDVCLAFKGLLDEGGALTNGSHLLLIDKIRARVLCPKDPELWRYLRPLGDCIFLSQDAVKDLARRCKRLPPSCCFRASNGVSQPSRSSGQSAPAPIAMIVEEIRSAYDCAEVAGQKPPNIKELSRAVHLVLEQKNYRASRRQIEKLAETAEFKSRRSPPGKRRSEPALLGRNLGCEATKVAGANVHLMKSE
jgi:hypothetical protein